MMRTWQAGNQTIAIFDQNDPSGNGIAIQNDGTLHVTLPQTMGWKEAQMWAHAILSVAETAQKRAYPPTLAEAAPIAGGPAVIRPV
jgi:hypothetical protein